MKKEKIFCGIIKHLFAKGFIFLIDFLCLQFIVCENQLHRIIPSQTVHQVRLLRLHTSGQKQKSLFLPKPLTGLLKHFQL